jgi:hypothetical protein
MNLGEETSIELEEHIHGQHLCDGSKKILATIDAAIEDDWQPPFQRVSNAIT